MEDILLTRSQKIVLRAVRSISERGKKATGPEIESACVSKGTAESIARSTMYKAIDALKDANLLLEKGIRTPGRKTLGKYYVLNYAGLTDLGLMDDIR